MESFPWMLKGSSWNHGLNKFYVDENKAVCLCNVLYKGLRSHAIFTTFKNRFCLLKTYLKDVSSAERSICFKQSTEPYDCDYPASCSFLSEIIYCAILTKVSNKNLTNYGFVVHFYVSIYILSKFSLLMIWKKQKGVELSTIAMVIFSCEQLTSIYREAGGSYFPWLAGYWDVWKPCASGGDQEKILVSQSYVSNDSVIRG